MYGFRTVFGTLLVLASVGCSRTATYPLPADQIHKITLDSRPHTTFAEIYAFRGGPNDGSEPRTGPIVFRGSLFGTTDKGGAGFGTIYEAGTFGNPVSERVLHAFTEGERGPSYGTRLTESAGVLYGATHNGIYEVSSKGGFKFLYKFHFPGTDAYYPRGAAVVIGGVLYWATDGGGRHGRGTVIAIHKSGVEEVLHSFAGGDADGAYPQGGLTELNGVLYGSTNAGGSTGCSGDGCGTIFAITTTGDEHIVYRFPADPKEGRPLGTLVAMGGNLYGITPDGGDDRCKRGCGTIFEVTPSGSERTVYRFKNEPDGYRPIGDLFALNGLLYGTTSLGGASTCSCGVVFQVTPAGRERVLYHFSGGADGSNPMPGLAMIDGTFYGVTAKGGRDGAGTIFELTP